MIHIIIRHCKSSILSDKKERPAGFSKLNCHKNLMETLPKDSKIYYILDGCSQKEHPILSTLSSSSNILEINEKSEPGSFHKVLDLIESLSCDKNDIVYALEDDYMHRPYWGEILKEGLLETKADYVSLYDHRDKYFLPQYANLKSQIIYTKSVHWRTSPSTTNTYAAKYSTWIRDIDIHRKWSKIDLAMTMDHEKFCNLWEKGKSLITPIPGYSTHMEPAWMCPIVKFNE